MNHQDFMAVLSSHSLFADFSNQALNQVLEPTTMRNGNIKKIR